MRGETAKLEPRWATGTFLGRTDESDEVIVGTAVGVEFAWSEAHERQTMAARRIQDIHRCALETKRTGGGSSDGKQQEEVHHIVQQHCETPGCSACSGVSSQHTTMCRERFEHLINPYATDVIPAIPSVAEDPSPAGGAASIRSSDCRSETCGGGQLLIRPTCKRFSMQPVSSVISVAFFHAWLERGVWVKPPKDLGLSDDWLWYVVKALCGMSESSKAFQEVVREMYTTYEWTLLQTVPCFAYCGRLDSLAGWHGDDFYAEGEPGALDEVDEMILASFKAKVLPRLGLGASTEGTILRRILRWSTEGVHMAPDAKHVENLVSLLDVKGAKPSAKPSSRAAGRGQRDVLEQLTASEATVFRKGKGIALYLGPDRFDLQLATKELAQDMHTPSKLSMLSFRRFVRYLLGAADVGPFFARTRMIRCWSGLMATGVETL